ncbi:L,D-transpeptidase family protein [Hansschlegelia beijingensis]|uniref:Murein L,D-transpeptidase YafK n=1 Tax=Hansschlegelia beijingensis TaxID=1133344 RepID=A0A7W6CUK6_9HYPH|nr:murein L,D-transpeptidase family protein [Hansschlegelia beijingensis]MBB3971393.1 murein L,D-transpeptidase YafK [Hansschlegelia beijingensis]
MSSLRARPFAVALVILMAAALGACSSGRQARIKTGSVSIATVSLMSRLDMPRSAPILIRIFKEEAVLEVWKQERDGRYGLLRSYPICQFSGTLGPKEREGDRQAPEGFYEIDRGSLNPFSRNHLAFNIGFPNAYDRSLGRTGSHLMVHGGCKSVGCYAMTHRRMEEIYGLVREALLSGQRSIPIQAFPFRMTEENMMRHADNPNMPFWEMLKVGYDAFAQTGVPPRVAACPGSYKFTTDPHWRQASDAEICEAAASYAAL